MSCWKMVIKIKNIFVGTYNNIFNKNKLLSTPRLLICSTCDKRVHIKGLGDCCSICGCVLQSKTRVSDEKCPNNKW